MVQIGRGRSRCGRRDCRWRGRCHCVGRDAFRIFGFHFRLDGGGGHFIFFGSGRLGLRFLDFRRRKRFGLTDLTFHHQTSGFGFAQKKTISTLLVNF